METLSSIRSPLCLCLFGAFQASVCGEPLGPLRSRKGQWLLALLALRHGRGVDRSWLTGLLWPDSPPHSAAHSFRTSLNDLRRALGPAADRLHSSTSRTLTLDLTGAAVDLLRFDEAVARGGAAELAEAVGLYRGPLLEGCAEEWIIPERQAREQAFLGALETLAAAATEKGDVTAAEQHLRRAIAVSPLRERAYRSLMQLLADLGLVPAALSVYQELQHRLHRDINAVPDPATTALFETLRRRSGRNGSGAKSPAPARAKATPGNLPRALTRFIGREAELITLAGWLRQHRLVTLTGAGGCGKSRLAIEAVRQGESIAVGGAWFIDLAPVSDPDLIIAAVAAAIGVREEIGRPLRQLLLGALHSRRMVLLLDNCEHLLQGCASLAAELLEECPQLRILATSREALGVAGEAAFRVPPLALPPAAVKGETRSPGWTAETGLSLEDWLTAIARSEAVQLFLDRAAAVLPAFGLTPRNASAVAAVCRRLDGMPLALELAAARLKLLPVAEIAQRLDDRFRLLTQGNPAAPARHQTLRVAIDWSYDLLSVREQTLLRRLSVFAGGFTVAAAEAICSDPPVADGATPGGAHLAGRPEGGLREEDVLDLLGELIEKSLVAVDQRHGEVRHRLLETMRAYAGERLAPAERAAIASRHATYFLGIAEAADLYQGVIDQPASLKQVETEYDNLRAALHWALGPDGSLEVGLRMASALDWYCGLGASLREGHARLETAVARAESSPEPEGVSPSLLARAVYKLGRLRMEVRAEVPARLAFERSLSMARELGDRRLEAWSMQELGTRHSDRSEYQEAIDHFHQSLTLFQELGDRRGVALALARLGWIEEESSGDPARATRLLEESLEIAAEIGDLTIPPLSLNALWRLARSLDDLDGARLYAERSLETTRTLGIPSGVAAGLEMLAHTAHDQGEYATAKRLICECLQLQQEQDRDWGTAAGLSLLGDIEYGLGNFSRSASVHREALARWRRLKFEGGMVWCLCVLSEIARRDDGAARSGAFAREAWRIWNQWEERWRVDLRRCLRHGWRAGTLLRSLAIGAEADGDLAASQALAAEARAATQRTGAESPR